MRLPTECSQRLLVDSGQRHIRVRHNICAFTDEVLRDAHRILGIHKRLGVLKIRTSVDDTLRDHLLILRQCNSTSRKFLSDDLKTSFFNFLWLQLLNLLQCIHLSLSLIYHSLPAFLLRHGSILFLIPQNSNSHGSGSSYLAIDHTTEPRYRSKYN